MMFHTVSDMTTESEQPTVTQLLHLDGADIPLTVLSILCSVKRFRKMSYFEETRDLLFRN
jgi:hypothetical protein